MATTVLMSPFTKRPCIVDIVANYYNSTAGAYINANAFHGLLSLGGTVSAGAALTGFQNMALAVERDGTLTATRANDGFSGTYCIWVRDLVDTTNEVGLEQNYSNQLYYTPGLTSSTSFLDSSFAVNVLDDNTTQTHLNAGGYSLSGAASYTNLGGALTYSIYSLRLGGPGTFTLSPQAALPPNLFWRDFIQCAEA